MNCDGMTARNKFHYVLGRSILKTRSLLITLLLFLVSIASSCCAADEGWRDTVLPTLPVELDSNLRAIDLSPSLRYLVDRETKLNVLAVNTRFSEIPWGPLPPRSGGFERMESDHWMTTYVRTPSEKHDWVLSVKYSIIPDIEVWIFDQSNEVAYYRMGAHFPISGRPLKDKNFSIPVHLEANKVYQIIYRIDVFGTFEFPVTIATAEKHIEYISLDQLYSGLYYGIAFIMMLYNLMIFFYSKEWSYLVYVFVVASVALVITALDGSGFQYLWPNDPTLNYSIVTLSMGAVHGFTSVFAILFLSLRDRNKWLYYLLLTTALLNLGAVLSVLAISGDAAFIFASTVAQLSVLSIFIAGLYMWFRGQIYARFFILAWIVFSFLSFYSVLVGLGVLPGKITELTNGFRIASVVEMILLALGLARRIDFLAREQERANIESETKSQFIAQVSHELRTPMNAVLGMSNLLRDCLEEEKALHYNNVIYQSGLALLSTINDVLDAAKIDAGKLDLEEVPFDLKALCAQSLYVIEPQVMSKSLSLELNIDENIPSCVLGDPNRIRQILINFLSNAEKYTDIGQITLEAISRNNGLIRLAVVDTGRGVRPDEESEMFAPYAQNPISHTNSRSTSLGLYICKKLAEMMGGSIGLDSAVGEGSIFWVDLPLASSTLSPVPLAGEKDSHISAVEQLIPELNILVADDNTINQLVTETLLKQMGHSVYLVGDGKQAVDRLRKQRSEFDIVLMDCEMPIMDGFEASRQIRRDEHDSGFDAIPIVALTSYSKDDIHEQCKQAGINTIVTKPVRFSSLQEALVSCMKLINASRDSAAAINSTSSPPTNAD